MQFRKGSTIMEIKTIQFWKFSKIPSELFMTMGVHLQNFIVLCKPAVLFNQTAKHCF